MKQLLSIIIALAVALGGSSVFADTPPDPVMELSSQIVALERKTLSEPDFRILRPLASEVIRLERDDTNGAKSAAIQQVAYLLEDYRDMTHRTFSPHNSYDMVVLERALARLTRSASNPSAAYAAVVTELQEMHAELIGLLKIQGEKEQQAYRAYIEKSYFGQASSSYIPAIVFLMAHGLLQNQPQGNAVAVWTGPLIAASPALLCPNALNVVGPMIESNFDTWTRNLGRLTLQNVVGKAVELSLIQKFGLTKENAKALSKLAKGLQAGKGLPSLISAVVANRGASEVSARLQDAHPGFALVAAPFVAIKLIEEYSRPDMLKAASGFSSERWSGFDYWILRPYVFKALSTGSRYAVEKILQQKYLNSLAEIMKRSLAKGLSEGYVISLSKVGTSAATQGIMSAYEITLDAWSKEPMYTDKYARLEKFGTDVVLGVITSAVIGAVVPTSLCVAGPYIVVGFWIAYYTPSMASYGSSLVW